MELTLKNDKGRILSFKGESTLQLLDMLLMSFRYAKGGIAVSRAGNDGVKIYSAEELQSFENLIIEIK